MEGVSFRLAKIEDGTHYLDRKTSATGEILWEGLEPGVYSLVETATSGYSVTSWLGASFNQGEGTDFSVIS